MLNIHYAVLYDSRTLLALSRSTLETVKHAVIIITLLAFTGVFPFQ